MPVVFLEEDHDCENVGGELVWCFENNVFVNGPYGPTLRSGCSVIRRSSAYHLNKTLRLDLRFGKSR
jgi:hypothetical protein